MHKIHVKVFPDLCPYSVKRGSYVTYMDMMLNSCARVSELSFFVAVVGKAHSCSILLKPVFLHMTVGEGQREREREREKERRRKRDTKRGQERDRNKCASEEEREKEKYTRARVCVCVCICPHAHIPGATVSACVHICRTYTDTFLATCVG